MAFRSACRKAGIEDFRFHDLRHAFTSHLSMSGSNQRTVQQLLGHKDARMTTRYSHLSEKHLHHAVDVLDKVYNTIEGEEPSGKVQDKCGHKMDIQVA
jgi:integrase